MIFILKFIKLIFEHFKIILLECIQDYNKILVNLFNF